MSKVAFQCAHCGEQGERETGDYNRKVAAGSPLYCSRVCFRAEAKQRGTEQREARRRACETCGGSFIPRQVQLTKGGGRYCSQKCNAALIAAGQTEEAFARRVAAMREVRARGEWTVLVGEANPKWKGGPKACRIARRDSGAEAANTRRYRRNNPDKIREFALRRKGRRADRLPRGTIPKLRAMQRNRCAICRASLKGGDHLDHIVPLARGGKHTPGNLQLLCPPCNMHKSDRDPIQHMQSLGRLL